MAMSTEPKPWTAFECDGHVFEYAVMPAKTGWRPAGWPHHKPSPGRMKPVVLVVVRKLGDETGPATWYAEGTSITVDDAVATARHFWEYLMS
jgi:hypothetical protein